jgi:hypothetical protein
MARSKGPKGLESPTGEPWTPSWSALAPPFVGIKLGYYYLMANGEYSKLVASYEVAVQAYTNAVTACTDAKNSSERSGAKVAVHAARARCHDLRGRLNAARRQTPTVWSATHT